MKKIIVLLFLFQLSFAQNAFDKGNQLFKSGNFEEAIVNYESVLAQRQQSAELYFNLGNSYYKLHKVAPAIYNYEKALLLNPNDEEIKTNLEFAIKLKIDDIKELPKVGFSKLIENVTSSYNYDTWAWISVVFAFVFLAFFIGYYFSKSAVAKRSFFTGMFLILLLIIISTSSAVSEKSRIENDQPAIIFSEIALLKSEARLSSKTKATLHEGTKVYVLETSSNWKKVALTDETIGWIESEAIRELR